MGRNIRKILLGIIGGGMIYYGVLRGTKALVVGLSNYIIDGYDTGTNTMRVTLNIYVNNPLFVGITIQGITGDVYVNGQKVGFVNSEYNYHIAARRAHTIPVTVNLDMTQVGGAIINALLSGNSGSSILAFDGKLLVGEMGVPVSIQVSEQVNKLI